MQMGLGLFLLVATACANAQQPSTMSSAQVLPDAIQRPSPEPPSPQATTSEAGGLPDAPSYRSQPAPVDPSTLQPKGIPGVTADSLTAGPGTPPVSPISKRYLNLAMPNGVSSSSLIFVGGSTGVTAATDPHHQSDGGGGSSGKNCSRGPADRTESGWITSLLSITSKSQHYCSLGKGGFWKRGTYAATQALAAHRYDGANSFNTSQLFGPSLAAGATAGYYQYQSYSGERLATRFASAVGRDALRNMFREFWPDISTRVLHRHP